MIVQCTYCGVKYHNDYFAGHHCAAGPIKEIPIIDPRTSFYEHRKSLVEMVLDRIDNKMQDGVYNDIKKKTQGVRSISIANLIEVLIDCGIITEENLTK